MATHQEKSSIPIAFIICIIGILVFESLNLYFDDRFYTTEMATSQAAVSGLDGFRMKIKNEYSLNGGLDYDGLILGDSYLLSGVIPTFLEQQTGKKIFNFSGFGDHGVFASYCFLKNYLRTNSKKPQWIILGYHPDTLSRTKLPAGYMYELKEGNAVELIEEFGLAQGIKFQIPSLKHQFLYRQILFSFQRPRFLTPKQIREFRESVITEKGFYSPHAFQAVAEPARDEDLNTAYRFHVSRSARENLQKIVRLAQDNGIRVIYVVPTLSDDWGRLYDRQSVRADYQGFLSSFHKLYPNIEIWDFQPRIKDFSLYSDRLHLNVNGAQRLTGLIARRLNSAIPQK